MPTNFIDPLDLDNPREIVSSTIKYDGEEDKQLPNIKQGRFIDPLDLDNPSDVGSSIKGSQPSNNNSWLTNFLVNSISDVGAGAGAIFGAGAGLAGGGFTALASTPAGTFAGASLGAEVENLVRNWLQLPPEEQFIQASQDPVLNDIINTFGLDLAGGAVFKGLAKGAGAITKGIGRSVSGATDEAVESATRLSEQGIDLKSAPAFESGNTGFFSSETLARMFAPDQTEKTRKAILQSQREGFEEITGSRFDDLTPEGTFERGREVIDSTKQVYDELIKDQGMLQTVRAEKDRVAELLKTPVEQLETYKFKVRDTEQLKKTFDDLGNQELEILNRTLPKEAAFSVQTLRDAATKKVPLARPTIKAILAEPERVASVLSIDDRLKETLRDEALTQLTRIADNSKKLSSLKSSKQIFEQLLPSESSYDDLVDFYTAIEKSTAGDLVNNPAATLVALKGSNAIIQFGKEVITGGGPKGALARLVGNVGGGVQATIAGNIFARKILLNPKYSKIAIKAASGQRLSNRELDKFIMAMVGSKITLQGLNNDGSPKDAGKTTVLRETVAPSNPTSFK